ncbi:5-dehydro-2-deoxygluconokinase [Providencia rustigianii]|uniref:5-dehydro-2-deoxygluconokinase n=1 Tax=Providencia rustigianii TaxID=158850 RepID=A0A379G6B2_9GAMM|nr:MULTISPECIES: aminoimidazole riboside kinase [Providencia]MTC55445.1 aminoimidazole riboside kinase [Providencia rustigianii]SPY78421.1 5-dehydro-2-deoxygluconokinase [Providencia rustigianii]SUC36421.1 5-dehydro-2-deoxygluconokinase [Providencia rustigianii]VEB72245.1 5-dehydro-2-deoxygluconokinase [Providencia rustigianii]
MTAKVWVLGDAVIDLIPEKPGVLLQLPGGAPANVAVGISRLEGRSGFIGRVGDDPFGKFMQRTLQQENVDTTYMKRDPKHRTSTVVVELDEDGERTFTFMVRPSADLFIEPTDLPVFKANEWLHVCSIALSAEPSRSTTFLAMEQIHNAGGMVSFDPNIRTDLWQDSNLLRECLHRALELASVAKLSEEELLFISGELDLHQGIEILANRYNLKLLLVTLGKDGVMVYWNGKVRHFSARPVMVVDTTGAGDAFVAGLLAGLAVHGLPSDEQTLGVIIEQAQACGALATTAKGAMTALPYRKDLERSL